MTGWRMRPTASALGVIAIVSVMITATASESSSIVMDQMQAQVDPEDRQIPVDEDLRTLNWTLVSVPGLDTRSNDTANDPMDTSVSNEVPASRNDLELEAIAFGEPQRDESGSLLGPVSSGNVWDEKAVPEGEDELDNPRNKVQDTSRDYLPSTGPSRAEASTFIPWEDQLPWRSELEDAQVDDEGLPGVLERVDEDGAVESVPETHNREFLDGTVTWISGIPTESRPNDQRNVEDIRAISFPVPPPEEQFQDRFDSGQRDEERRKENRKEHSRTVNNHLLGSGKSTKAFYEIKPSIRTQIENDQLYSASTHRTLPARKFVLPTVGSAFGKFGPYFEDGDQDANVTARIGSTMLLDCRIGMLGDKEVAWLQQHSEDSFRLLTVGRNTYSIDQRISLNFRYPSNWRLQIRYASPRDSGLYKCQITTHPPMVKKINVVVTAPELTITDDSGRVVPKERHLKAGSALKLRCEVRDVLEPLKETVIWTRGDETLTDDVSENRTTEVSVGKEVLVVVSTLIVERASPRHAGNYSCMVPGKVNTTIAVHVLNGELPAAVHDGNGVSRAFLNLWLIHLTMSYVFSR
ncbi:uncharacterized protein LOC143209156 [Lasioglossum baleicum]|uniref:uncharacterized protein LOC143209156 n=1 Tax=Lasioglossum baleicum TaxID=434251 RepID=UPI003FCE3787